MITFFLKSCFYTKVYSKTSDIKLHKQLHSAIFNSPKIFIAMALIRWTLFHIGLWGQITSRSRTFVYKIEVL